MTKSISSAVALLLVLGAASGTAALAEAAPAVTRCETQTPGPGDRRDVACVIHSAAAGQRLRFSAKFLGSHDDTVLSMAASLNQQAITCDSGSKTSSRFEDGEVTLECRFAVPAGASKHALQVAIEWTHAQYAGFELSAL